MPAQGQSSSGGLPSPQDQAHLPEREQNTLECPMALAPCAWVRFFWDLRISLNKTKRSATQKRANDTKEPQSTSPGCSPDTLHAVWEEKEVFIRFLLPREQAGGHVGKSPTCQSSRLWLRASVPLVSSVWCPLMVVLTLPHTSPSEPAWKSPSPLSTLH